jgi:hypothetical protein
VATKRETRIRVYEERTAAVRRRTAAVQSARNQAKAVTAEPGTKKTEPVA